MAHSFDNTLLQRMGFSDPDRKTPAHDDACIEIATDPERFLRAVPLIRQPINARCEMEIPLQKGDGKYATTVGFIDAVMTFESAIEDYGFHKEIKNCDAGYGSDMCLKLRSSDSEYHQNAHAKCFGPSAMNGPTPLRWVWDCLLVEVKTKIANVGDLLRQMNLYREYKLTHTTEIGRQGKSIIHVGGYVIWSLDQADTRFAKLLSQQGYTLIAGPLP